MSTKKNKDIHRFKVGDLAVVLSINPRRFLADPAKPADKVEVVKVTQMTVVAQALERAKDYESDFFPRFMYRRKGNRWVDNKKDHYYLVPA